MAKKLRLSSAGLALRELREERGLSLDALAARVRWNKSRLSRYENDLVALSTDAIEQIAGALGIPPFALLVRCLKHVYPELSESASVPGRLLDRIAKEFAR